VNIFIAGPRAIKTIDKKVDEGLKKIIKRKFTVLVGDANGMDKAIQQFFYEHHYQDVFVYASQGKARNNVGNWPIQSVEVSDKVKGFDFYAAKDKSMAENADYGFMIWNGKSKGTLNNIINLTKQNKKVLLYYTPHKKFYMISEMAMVEKMAAACGEDINRLFLSLSMYKNENITDRALEQISLYDVNETTSGPKY
jgi:hypothetical protein